MSDTVAHIDIKQTLQAIKYLLAQAKVAKSGDIGYGGVDTTITESDGNIKDGVVNVGMDYSSDNLDATIAHESYAARLDHMDTYFGRPTRIKFLGVDYSPAIVGYFGHNHTGVAGHGPHIPAANILAPEGALGGAETFAGHAADASLHPLNTSPAFADAVFDPMVTTGKWQVLTGGVEAYRLTTGDSRMTINSGTIVRLRAPAKAWTDKFFTEFDLQPRAANNRSFDLYLLTEDNADFSLVMRISASSRCGIGVMCEADSTWYEITDPSESFNYEYTYADLNHVRVSVYGKRVVMLLSTPTGSVLQTATIPDTIGVGNLPVSFTGGDIRIMVWPDAAAVDIGNFAACHLPELDISDFTDVEGLHPVNETSDKHAGTHAAFHLDEVDIAGLADSDGRMLTSDQKLMLTNSPYLYTGLDSHVHMDNEVDLTGDVGGNTNLREHANDETIHSAGTSVERVHLPWPTSVYDEYYDGYPFGLHTNVGGGSEEALASPACHSHVRPYWMVDLNYDTTLLPDYKTHYCDSGVRGVTDASEFSFYPEHLAASYKINPLWPVRYAEGSITGELLFDQEISRTAAGFPVGMLSYLQVSPHYRAKMRIFARDQAGANMYVKVSLLNANVWITIRNVNTGYRLKAFPGLFSMCIGDGQGEVRDRIVKLPLAVGFNDLYVYAYIPKPHYAYARVQPCHATGDGNTGNYSGTLIMDGMYFTGTRFVPALDYDQAAWWDWWELHRESEPPYTNFYIY